MCSWTDGVNPACTLVVAYGRLHAVEDLALAIRFGVRFSDFCVPRYSARSFGDHSHSRLRRKSNGDGKASLLIVVSTVKIFGPWSCRILPSRQTLLWRSRLVAVHEAARVLQRLRVVVEAEASGSDATPVVIDFQPPSIATWLTLA